MASRMDLQRELKSILGTSQVYYQSPENLKMSYPAIVFFIDDINNNYANDHKYLQHNRYMITLIDRNPESEYVDSILALPYCSFDRHYIIDNLNHFIFEIYW